MTNGRLFLLSLPLLLILASGCGTSKTASASLSGKVSYGGAPVTAGTVTFYGKDGGTYPMAIGSDGSYFASELPPGEGALTVETESANKKNAQTYGGRGGKGMAMSPKPEGSGGTETGPYVKIPAKYAAKETSNLTVTIARGKNTHDLNLTD